MEGSIFSQVSQSKNDMKGFADDDAEQDMLDTGESSESDEEEGNEPEEDPGPSGGEGSEEWAGFDSEEETIQPVKTPQVSMKADDSPAAPMPGSKYVPPHMRDHSQGGGQGNAEADLKLTRQLKGLLNRMSEQNIASIIDGVEEIYRNQRRHDATATLTALIIDGISAHSMLLDSYVVLHAAFVSALHKLIGIEFAASFVQNVVAAYERHFADVQTGRVSAAAINGATGEPQQEDDETIGKECSNLIILLSELYNFQVISCVLVCDVIRGLLDGDLTEFKVELLLKVTRNSGQQLRQDDPTALKSIIQIVHSKLSGEANAMSSRTRFMVETLANLKNNKLKRNAVPTAGGESVERLKKFLAGLSKKRHVLSHEPLRVSLEDLHSAESKGKWWLVGAAWGGDPLVDHQENQCAVAEKDEADTLSENALLKLARKQGMNTEIRRGIFVVLMSSEDYVDACERLSQLKMTEVQQREIIRVILHCCGNEKSYNPYYALIGQQLCRSTHSHTVTLQFCLWDFLRDLGETNVGGAEVIKNLGEDSGFNVKHISSTRMRNIAKAYGWWVAKDCCTLAILKPVDFTILKQQSHTFLKELLSQIFISTQVSTPLLSGERNVFPTTRNRGPLEEVFMKATRMQNLSVGLIHFISEAFKGDNSEDNGFIKWASQVAKDTLRTGMDIVTSSLDFS
ncbi:ARM repeat-containing protein [Laetiporus sulphureus 93-53]|uniref:ARM repeat-containing protein n=1 Tax=Laetiporus sulphureus 93-53 TaxID=1314785 RepID=A0A165BDE3_9APHY|nr:ARM repeat-containing protein [Laetiporus sulphureus 93-53]KZT00798.1 ARM repeat-containing protein [Laetiporus sulphureus 93-53]